MASHLQTSIYLDPSAGTDREAKLQSLLLWSSQFDWGKNIKNSNLVCGWQKWNEKWWKKKQALLFGDREAWGLGHTPFTPDSVLTSHCCSRDHISCQRLNQGYRCARPGLWVCTDYLSCSSFYFMNLLVFRRISSSKWWIHSLEQRWSEKKETTGMEEKEFRLGPET